MSYDIEFGVKVEGLGKVVKIADSDPRDPTYNIGDMVRKCTGWDFNQGEWYLLKDVIPNIEKGIHEMRFNKHKYKDLLPSNGWGNYSSVVEALEGILNTAQDLSFYREMPIEYLYVRW